MKITTVVLKQTIFTVRVCGRILVSVMSVGMPIQGTTLGCLTPFCACSVRIHHISFTPSRTLRSLAEVQGHRHEINFVLDIF